VFNLEAGSQNAFNTEFRVGVTDSSFAAACARVPARVGGEVDDAPANLNFDDNVVAWSVARLRRMVSSTRPRRHAFHTCAHHCTGTPLARIEMKRGGLERGEVAAPDP
jgi:hypothetical protein